MEAVQTHTEVSPVAVADALRLLAARKLNPAERAYRGQFLTPAPVARLLASLLTCADENIHLLDAGAGTGTLLGAAVEALCARPAPPAQVRVVAYEIDPLLAEYATRTMAACAALCEAHGVAFTGEVRERDYLEDAAELLETNLLQPSPQIESELFRFNCAIQNPPYRKITSESNERWHLRRMGVETTNLYTGFLAATAQLLAPSGELVAITPRSFCNGRYFRPFRKQFLGSMALQRLHLFETRTEAFSDDQVLQETLVLRAEKQAEKPEQIVVTTGTHTEDAFLWREVAYTDVVSPDDPEQFIRIPADEVAHHTTSRMARFTTRLVDLGLKVSTGRVVHFRASEHLCNEPEAGAAPLIWPLHLNDPAHRGFVSWPQAETRKPNALAITTETQSLLMPSGHYVLVKRFSSKEQARRISAAVFDPAYLPDSAEKGVGFENHLNYFHADGRGLDATLARGLALFLNTTLVDEYFRLSSGHTQVNATDLRNLHYPSREALLRLGAQVNGVFPAQVDLDALFDQHFFSDLSNTMTLDPVQVKKRVDEGLDVLVQLGLPKAQQNERSALTLLALLNLRPGDPWADAEAPLIGITPIMDFIAQHYGKTYAPNTRETVRRQTVHQFIEAGIIVRNPDAPERPVNSPHNVYQIETGTLEAVQAYGTEAWAAHLKKLLAEIGSLKERYAYARRMQRIPIQISEDQTITLSPGGQNVLIKQIIETFAPHFVPGGRLLYVGDAEEKFGYFDTAGLKALGVEVNEHGKMPDVVLHHTSKNWLVLVEAVTSHGPVDPKRHDELRRLFGTSVAGLIFVTAFLTRDAFRAYASDVAWETEVWIADHPSHLVHFDGERFLGPYSPR